MAAIRKPLSSHKRIVIKIGSALLVDRGSGLKKAWLDAVCADIAGLRAGGQKSSWSPRARSRWAAPC